MHIVFTRFPLESRHGGAEVQTISLMKGLISRGHTVQFLGSCPTLLKLCRENQIDVQELDIGPPPVSKGTAISFLWRQVGMYRKLREAFKSEDQIDAVCMLSLSEKILLTPVALDSNAKVLWIEHDTVGPWLTKNLYLPRLLKLSGSVTTIGVSNLSKDLYVKMGWDEDHTIAIPNGIDVERFGGEVSSPPQVGLRNPTCGGSFHVGTIARLSPEKGIDLLIHAVRDLPDVSLTIVGTGPQEGELHQLIEHFEMNDRCKIAYHLDDLGPFYRSLDLFILPSRAHDPFGLVAAEAMAMGVPTVVTKACGVAGHIVGGAEAIVVQENSSATLRGAIEEMKEDLERCRRIAEEGKAKALRDFTVERMVERYERILLQ